MADETRDIVERLEDEMLREDLKPTPSEGASCTSSMDGCPCILPAGHEGAHHDSVAFWEDADADGPIYEPVGEPRETLELKEALERALFYHTSADLHDDEAWAVDALLPIVMLTLEYLGVSWPIPTAGFPKEPQT